MIRSSLVVSVFVAILVSVVVSCQRDASTPLFGLTDSSLNLGNDFLLIDTGDIYIVRNGDVVVPNYLENGDVPVIQFMDYDTASQVAAGWCSLRDAQVGTKSYFVLMLETGRLHDRLSSSEAERLWKSVTSRDWRLRPVGELF